MKKATYFLSSIFGIILRISAACILLLFGSLLHFWLVMPKTAVTSTEEWYRLLNQNHFAASLIEAPFGTYLFWSILTGIAVCLLFNGRDLSLSRIRQVSLISKQYWRRTLFMTVAIIDIVVLQICFIRPSSLSNAIANHLISAEDIFYVFSGTGALRNITGEAGDLLFAVSDTFVAHLSLYQSKIIDLLIVYLTYVSIRVLFDTKLPLSNSLNKEKSQAAD